MILQIEVITNSDVNRFIELVGKEIESFQNSGFKVEVQYSTSILSDEVVYSALLIKKR